MKTRLLIVNGFDRDWKYIPMGSFGLCDYLNDRGIESRILNAAIYGENEYLLKLISIIHGFQPHGVGLVIHWKELLENSVYLASEIKKNFPDIMVVAGGITASFLGEELLRRFESIDFIIRGDPEKSLEMLLDRETPQNIPNLVYRDGTTIRTDESRYFIDNETLNRISYSKVDYLIDGREYLNIVDTALGFPVFIGRGCCYDCLYCGGSKKAFRRHSDREGIVYRSVHSVLEDLRLLLGNTDRIFLGYECNMNYIHELCAAVSSVNELAGRFTANYGAWHLVDSTLVDLYARAFKLKGARTPVIEISPETSIDSDRRVVRDKSLYFSNQELFECIKDIHSRLGGSVRIHVYYSRYHKTQHDKRKLLCELNNIHSLREELYREGIDNVDVKYCHLSTDPGSVYWDRASRGLTEADTIDLLFQSIRRSQMSSGDDFFLSNLCIYSPETLDSSIKFVYEQVIRWIDLLLRNVPIYYFCVTKALGFCAFARILDRIAKKSYSQKDWSFFENMSVSCLFGLIHQEVKERGHDAYEEKPCFFDGLRVLFTKYIRMRQHTGVTEAGAGLIEKPVLDESKICITEYDYVSKRFYESLDSGIGNPVKRKTLNVFCFNKIYDFDHKYYPEFELFNGKHTLGEVLDKTGNSGGLTKEEVLGLIGFFRRYHRCFAK